MKQKARGQKTLDKKSLPVWLTLFVVAALAVAAGLFCFMRYIIFKDAPDDLSDVVASTSTLLGVFTIGGAALIQLRKHIIFEEQSKLERDGKMSDRLTRAIKNLHNKDSLAVREGALFELKRLGLDFPQEQENIVRILGPFIREGIEGLPRNEDGKGLPRPADDVCIACEIVSLFYNKTGCRVMLQCLKADKLDLNHIQLQGANLNVAKLQGAYLGRANLQGAGLWYANLYMANLEEAQLKWASLGKANLQGAALNAAQLQGATLLGAQLQGAEGLCAEQLLNAKHVEDADLNVDLRAEYNKLIAERDKKKAKEG